MKSRVFVASASAAVMFSMLFVATGCNNQSKEKESDNQQQAVEVDVVELPIPPEPVELSDTIYGMDDFDKQPKLDENSDKYSFSIKKAYIKGKNEKAEILYSLVKLDADDNVIEIAENTDAVFSGIDGLKDQEVYRVYATIKGADASDRKAFVITKETMPLPVDVDKITKEELQNAFDALSANNLEPYYAIRDRIKATYKFSNLKSGENAPATATGIMRNIQYGDWEKVVVTDVHYDDLSYVDGITLKIVYK